MMENLDFKNPQWIENTSQIHRWVAIEIERYLQQVVDQAWLKKQSCKEGLKLTEALDELLQSQDDPRATYLKKQGALLAVLRELKLETFLKQKIKEAFGGACFFLRQHTGEMH
ncbi:MAG: hypothetical protein KBD23_05870 [Gammaproteobacteria bacterium]|nr:hypothetical protein [Gammaproteobacteria bacterium]